MLVPGRPEAVTSCVYGPLGAPPGSSTLIGSRDVSDSTVAGNNVGVSAVSNGAILSRCTDILVGMPPPACPAGHFTNTLQANTTDGAFSGSYSSN